MRSVTVVLPASIWAMMPMLRCLSIATVRATVYAPEKREAPVRCASKFKKTRRCAGTVKENAGSSGIERGSA
jgi:hypothetical protein